MSKKDKAAALINGMLGGKPEEPTTSTEKKQPETRTDLPEITIEELGLSSDLVEALNQERRKNAGRKPKSDLRSPKEYGCQVGDTRATFILKKELVTKLKYISVVETRTLKSMLSEILGNFVAEWERENGTINLKKSEQ